ncbi:MAG: hypothetical protein ACE15B_09875 [Bryobacteraceae bacterium]
MITRRDFVTAPPLAAAAPRGIRIEPDGMLAVNGRREFVLGLYQMPNVPDPWKSVREAGFNLVHLRPEARQYDAARAAGLFGWSTTGSLPEAGPRLRPMVEALKDHSALLFWETEDEPTYVYKKPRELRVPPERIVETARAIRRVDNSHPIYLNHAPTNLESTLRRYNEASDIVATDIYPVAPRGIREQFALWPDGQQGDFLNSTVSQVGQYADKMRRVAGPARAVFMVLQAFAWEMLRKQDRDPKMILYPTRAETRFMAYQAIVHGANGLLWWGIRHAPAGAPMWRDLAAVAAELHGIRTDLASPRRELALKIEYHDTGHSLDRGIEWIARGRRLIAVNADKNPVDASISGAGLAVREEFEPFGVRLYRLN